MEVAYSNVFRRFFCYDRFSSVSQMFIKIELVILVNVWEGMVSVKDYMPQKII